MKYKHLNKQTKELMVKSKKEKIEWSRKDHFISYENAEKILNYLEWVITQPQMPNIDLDSLSIIGETGMGKTTIVNKFKNDHNGMNRNLNDTPVAHCLLPDTDLGLKGLYISILHSDPFNYPISENRLRKLSVLELERSCIDLLKNTNVRVLFVDEIQHALSKRTTTTLNSLKRVVQLSGVPLVPVGTEKARSVFNLDRQLADRCPTKSFSLLEGWRNNKQFKQFLAGYEEFLPFPNPSNLSSNKKSNKIFELCAYNNLNQKLVNLRTISRLIKATTTMALLDNKDCLEFTYFENYRSNFL